MSAPPAARMLQVSGRGRNLPCETCRVGSDAARLVGWLNRHMMRGAFGGLAAALVVDLRGSDVAVAEQLLHLADVLAVLGVTQ